MSSGPDLAWLSAHDCRTKSCNSDIHEASADYLLCLTDHCKTDWLTDALKWGLQRPDTAVAHSASNITASVRRRMDSSSITSSSLSRMRARRAAARAQTTFCLQHCSLTEVPWRLQEGQHSEWGRSWLTITDRLTLLITERFISTTRNIYTALLKSFPGNLPNMILGLII